MEPLPTTAVGVKLLLPSLAEEPYRQFNSNLLPGVENILGVRMPQLRKLAGGIARADWRAYLAGATEDTYEEVLVQGLVIGSVKADFSALHPFIEAHVEKLSNWSTVDTFCAAMKIAKQEPEAMWALVEPYYGRSDPYALRFAIVMTLFYFLDAASLARSLSFLDGVRHEAYYVRMAVAWAVSMAYVADRERTGRYLARCNLDDWTFNKALQKIIESRQVDDTERDAMRAMKRRRQTREKK